MKRMSIAEQTLKKQIDRIEAEMAEAWRSLHEHQAKITVMQAQQTALYDEMSRLRALREASSAPSQSAIPSPPPDSRPPWAS